MEWFRSYLTDVDDYILQKLPAEIYRFYMNLKCLACHGDGVLPPLPAIMYRCHKTEAEVLEYLAALAAPGVDLVAAISPDALILTRWAKEQRSSDNSAPRVAKLREKLRREALGKCANHAVTLRNGYCNGLETETETETEQKRAEIRASDDAVVSEPPPILSKKAERKSRKNGLLSPLNPQQQVRFEEFWSSYWRKKDRVPSQWAFHDLIGDSEERFQGLLRAVQRDSNEMLCRPVDKRPYGATYIRKQPWQDGEEPEPAQRTPRTEKPATSFPREIYGAEQPIQRTPEEIAVLREQINDPSPAIRRAAQGALAEYQESSSWKN